MFDNKLASCVCKIISVRAYRSNIHIPFDIAKRLGDFYAILLTFQLHLLNRNQTSSYIRTQCHAHTGKGTTLSRFDLFLFYLIFLSFALIDSKWLDNILSYVNRTKKSILKDFVQFVYSFCASLRIKTG